VRRSDCRDTLSATSVTFVVNGLFGAAVPARPGSDHHGGTVQQGLQDTSSTFDPVRILDLELGAPLAPVTPARAQDGRPYLHAFALIRLHQQPVAEVDLTLDADGSLPADALAAQVWDALGPAINAHVARDGLGLLDALPAAGLGEHECAGRLPLPDPPPSATVVVATRDRPRQLARSLDALLRLTYPSYELLVVDNAPTTPLTAELVAAYADDHPHVRYVREDVPGLSNARNRGLREAAGEIVAYTDDDVEVDPHWLAALVAAFGAAPGVVGVAGFQAPAERETAAQAWFDAYCGLPLYRREVFDLGDHRPDDPLFPYNMGKFPGATMAFDAAALRGIGGFDPALGAGTGTYGGEDLDAYFRLIGRGGTCVVEPAAVIWHYNRREYPTLRQQVRGFGVGLTAMVTKQLLDRPSRLLELAVRLPAAARFLLAADSDKNVTKRADYPAELRRLELLGMVNGPAAYLRSRRTARRLLRGEATRTPATRQRQP
jgi:glycosyltransferase involved in cell wall biosynthesis